MASRYTTALFCAVLHEMPDHAGALKAVQRAGIRRIILCDYDPDLGGWLRLWINLFEPDARRWWGCDPGALLPESDWCLRRGQITPSLLSWTFERRLA